MALPSSGPISLYDVNVELGVSGTATRSLNDATTRTLFGIASGAIDLNTGRGKSNAYPAQVLTYNGTDRAGSTAVTVETSTGFTVSVAGSTTIVGTRLDQLHVICWGGGGAGSTWPSSAAGGYGGAGYRISLLRSSGGAVASLLNSITSLAGAAGNAGTPWWTNGYFSDNRQAGGAGGTSYLNFNGTRLITAKGGNGSRQIYNNGDSNYIYPTYSSYVGDNGGTGAGEGGAGGAATYGGGGGASNSVSTYGTSTYGGRGGARVNGGAAGTAPAGGGGGYDTGSGGRIPRGAIGRVVVYINTAPPF